jgi:hypothetical protein
MRYLLRQLILLIFLCSLATGANATGSFSSASSSANEPIKFKPEQIMQFSKKVEKILADKGAYVAIVARMGRPPSELPEGMHFTHASFAVYSNITTSDGRTVNGYVMHNLYQHDKHPDTSGLVQDYPVEFFAGAAKLEAGIIIPSPELQKRLLAIISSPTYNKLHNPRYSAIANPYASKFQNCTGFVLDVVNAAIYETDDIKKIKAQEKAYFTAQPVNVAPLKLLLGSMFSSEISTADQHGKPVTATFEIIGEYLTKYDKGSAVIEVLPD